MTCEVLLRNCVSAADTVATMTKASQLNLKVVSGFRTCGSPVGADNFVAMDALAIIQDACMRAQMLVVLAKTKEADAALSIQAAMTLMRYCINPAALTYLVRTTPPKLINDQLKSFDECIVASVLAITGHAPGRSVETSKRRFVIKRINLDSKLGGLGLPSMCMISPLAYMGSLALTMSVASRVMGAGVDLKTAFPHGHELIEKGIFKDLKSNEGLNMSEFYAAPVLKLQKPADGGGLRLAPHVRAERLLEQRGEGLAAFNSLAGGLGLADCHPVRDVGHDHERRDDDRDQDADRP